MDFKSPSGAEVDRLSIDDLNSNFLSLRIGEKIPRLQIREIRKITNPNREDNLSSVNYRYIIESVDSKLLTVNTWSLWRKISAALKEAGKVQATLELEHIDVDNYSVKLLNS